ncbi:MAG: hypothetical protein M1445_14420 [Bacteroidetes bacterium]|nr:hypothetical protein [Bacteroidota bacterium]
MVNFPLIIENEPELRRFIRDIFREVVKDPVQDLPALMSIRQCCKQKGISRDMVKTSIDRGELKLSVIGGKTGIKRNDFLNWINKTK